MQFDSGEVLQGLDEDWTFLGANAVEWGSGLVVFLMISLFASSPARAMPFMLAGWIFTTVNLAILRNSFPDQQKGVRNALTTACGIEPLDIPAPSKLQPIWSAAPLKQIPERKLYHVLGLEEVFPNHERQLTDPDDDGFDLAA